MARTTGANAKLAMKYEGSSAYGTRATGNYQGFHFVSHTLGGAQELIESNLVGQGRDPAAPTTDAVTADGDVVVPLDLTGIGFWLKLLLGNPTTATSGSNRTHVFQSGGTTLPSASIETQLLDVPHVEQVTGCRADTLAINLAPTGLVDATIGIIAQGSTVTAANSAGTIVAAPTLERFTPYQAEIQRTSSDLANVTAMALNFSNGLDAVRTIRGDNKIGGIDLGQTACTGTIEMRLADQNMINDATANTGRVFTVTWEISAAKSLKIQLNDVRLSRPKVGVAGPEGVSVTFDFQCAKGSGTNPMLEATLKNQTANYDIT